MPDAGAPLAASTDNPAPPQSLPSPFDDVVQGQIPAVLIPPIEGGQPNEVQQFVGMNFGDLLSANLDYKELKDSSIVFYNPNVLPEAELEAAIKDGSILKIAAPVTQMGAPAEVAASGEMPPPPAVNSPALANTALPAAEAPPGVENARLRTVGATKKVSPVMPNPVPDRLAKRAV